MPQPTALDDKDFEEALSYIDGSTKGIPLRYWPNEMCHFGSTNAWDCWENERFEAKMPDCVQYWHSVLSYVRHHMKLRTMRQKQPTYWHKSERNYRRYRHSRRRRAVDFVYVGTQFD